MKIAMVASESNPLAKTGGLGDVVYSLSKALVKLDNEVMIVIPYYDSIQRLPNLDISYVTSFFVGMSWRHEEAKVYMTIIDGIKFYLISNQRYFSRQHLYGDFDDGERFAFFTLAARELFKNINNIPDVVHIHDWQVGMFPCLVKEQHDTFYEKTKFVLTIHNPAFQGLMPRSCLGDFYSLPQYLFDNGQVRFKDQLSTLKTAIVYSDKITTVSHTHRKELLTPEGGMGLDGVLKMREYDFMGIINGVDFDEFNPSKDPLIAKQYSLKDALEGKEENKRALCKELHIKNYKKPTFSIISRLTWQKGMDLAYKGIEFLLKRGANVIILGSGEYEYERRAEELRAAYPSQMAIYIGYNNTLAHKIYAASDFVLMPSLFEPCGITQMIGQRYGTLPIVRLTGGLEDTVVPYNRFNLEKASGFGFHAFNTDDYIASLVMALDAFNDMDVRKKLINNIMRIDNSWSKNANTYLDMYKSMFTK